MDIKTLEKQYEELQSKYLEIRLEWLEWEKFKDFMLEMLAQYKTNAASDLPTCVLHIAARAQARLVPMEELKARAAKFYKWQQELDGNQQETLNAQFSHLLGWRDCVN